MCELFKGRRIFVDLLEDRRICDMLKIEYSREDELLLIGREEGREEGMKEGIIEGRKEGIRAFVETLTELGIKREDIKNKLLMKYALTETQAEDYMDVYFVA
jgi:predicted transposase YdaD